MAVASIKTERVVLDQLLNMCVEIQTNISSELMRQNNVKEKQKQQKEMLGQISGQEQRKSKVRLTLSYLIFLIKNFLFRT